MEGRVVGWGVCCVDHLLQHCWGCYSAADDDCQRLGRADECEIDTVVVFYLFFGFGFLQMKKEKGFVWGSCSWDLL